MSYKKINYPELLLLINKTTETDCVVHEGELRIGVRDGLIKIPLNAVKTILFEEREPICWWR